MDNTEQFRRQRVQEINANPLDRKRLEEKYGKVWDTEELGIDFHVIGFAAPYVVVKKKRKSAHEEEIKGSLEFQHMPRFYFKFREHKP